MDKNFLKGIGFYAVAAAVGLCVLCIISSGSKETASIIRSANVATR